MSINFEKLRKLCQKVLKRLEHEYRTSRNRLLIFVIDNAKKKRDKYSECPCDCEVVILSSSIDYLIFMDDIEAKPNSLARSRFDEGAKFICFKKNHDIIVSAWYLANCKNFHVEEINRHISLRNDQYVIFDCYTYDNHRRKGYYTALLYYIQCELIGNLIIIYALRENIASIKGIKRSGFPLIGEFGSYSFSLRYVMKKYSVDTKLKIYSYYLEISKLIERLN